MVVNIDANEYSTEYPSALWSYLRSGVLIDTDFGGLVYYQQESMASETIELVRGAEGDSQGVTTGRLSLRCQHAFAASNHYSPRYSAIRNASPRPSCLPK